MTTNERLALCDEADAIAASGALIIGDFIFRSRTLVPALSAALREAEAELAGAKAEIERLKRNQPTQEAIDRIFPD